jgi:hypothetical protein
LMFFALLFLHVVAVAMLFAGIGLELAVFYHMHRATTVAHARAAVLNMPLVGPIMGIGALLLIVMGIAMVYVGHVGWQPWVIVAVILTLFLAVTGPVINGKRGEAMHALVEKSPDGPVTPEIAAACTDRVLNYSVFLTACELVAAVYIMTNKPGLTACIAAVVIAAVIAALPTVGLLRARAAAASIS